MPLQDRAKAFLVRPIPDDLDYVPDSISERIIRTYAATGTIDLDAELAEILALCVSEAEAAARQGGTARRAYFRESAAILGTILEQA